MATNTRLIRTTPNTVWAVLADPWLFPGWVVGASRMRDVEGHWPEVGAKLHHSVGSWPFLLNDETCVEAVEPQRSLTLIARGRPAGEARVIVELAPQGGGTEVTLREDAVSGPARLVPTPVRAVALKWRNRESLERLAFIAEGRAAGATSRQTPGAASEPASGAASEPTSAATPGPTSGPHH